LKSSRNSLVAVAVLALAGLAARADLPRWFQNIPAVKRFEGVCTTTVAMPGGPVTVRRDPAQMRASLTQLIAAAPNDAELYALRARAAEEQLDAAAAEADWIEQAKLAADPGAGQLALADFYHRRLRPADEVRALEAAAEAPNPPAEKYMPATGQRAWRTLQRLIALVDAQALPVETGEEVYRLWIKRYSQRRAVYRQFFGYLLDKKQLPAADALIAEYAKAFPTDTVFPTSARAALAESRGTPEQALAVYDQAFQPLGPPELVKDYFDLLAKTHNLRTFLGKARTAVSANPTDLNAAARIFYYYQQRGNLPEAKRALVEFRQRKDARQSAWSAAELWALGRLMEAVHDYDEAARDYHAVYALAAATPQDRERALAALAQLLFTAPEQPIRFGAGDLSFYKDIATMDPHPGFLNGILSLLLNSTMPEYKYSEEERKAVAYFHRARAAELLALFDSKFPKSNRRPVLWSKLIETYATYGASDGVIRAGKQFLAAFPKTPLRTEVALRMADAYARTEDERSEFATYDALLKELAERAGGVPLGENATGIVDEAPPEESAGADEDDQAAPASNARSRATAREARRNPARSADYARVLDRYISRLVSMHRPLDALALLRRELDRNPNDPGLYSRLAAFMEQNKLDAGIEQVYRRAIQQFSSVAWYDKLARWYLRGRKTASLEQLTRQVVDIFAGTDLESYFSQAVNGSFTSSFQLGVNLYAHQRFPYDLVFVRNLLSAYSSRTAANPVERERLLRNYWFYADDLKRQLFEDLSNTGRLYTEVEALHVTDPAAMAATNPAAVQFAGEAQAWWAHFEAAAPALEAVAARFPGNAALVHRAAQLDRSLAAFDASYTERAVAFSEKLYQFDQRDRQALTEVGEIYADREEFAKAKPYWDRIARIEPGKKDGYLEAATIFWDYFQFDDALRLIEQARQQTANPALYAYEAGAIYESKSDYSRAIAEYLKGADAAGSARARLLALSKRPAHKATIDRLTAERVAAANPDAAAVSLRIAVLEAQNRASEVGPFLADLASRTTSVDLLVRIRSDAASRGFEAAVQRTQEREVTITTDPVERMRARLELMRLYESKGDTAAAGRAVEELYRENPAILGVVRAAVDFYWRNKMHVKAVETLVGAAGAANAPLRRSFTLEAAGKAAESGDFARARELATTLLDQEPLNAETIAAMADVYARQGDDRGLRAFYEEKIGALRGAPSRIAELRRSLIPVLTRQKDYAAAMDQYIEILKSYPEDDELVREAALYAAAHGGRERLRGYFVKASADSPRDFRWPMVLARIETFFEDLPAAIAAYSHAIAIRPDRVDLRIARASLEERLMRFDEALASYTKLYDLTYHDPHWMEKAAEIHARQGRCAEAVAALRRGFIEGRPERAQQFFDIARILDGWDLVAEARPFAERGVALSGKYLFSEQAAGAAIYARVMTRLRACEAAIENLRAAGSPDDPGFAQALSSMGETVARYFTPEEKTALEAALEKEKAAVPVEKLLPLVQRAGLTHLEAKWRFELMMANRESQARLIEIQRQRMQYDELGVELEARWQAVGQRNHRDTLLDEAAEAYRAGGNVGAELRVLALRQERLGLSGELLQRYLDLLAVHMPDRLVVEAGQGKAPYPALNTAAASGNPKLALEAIRARTMPRVWTRAYTGLAGVYYADTSPEVRTAFAEAIGDVPIGERLGRRVDRDQQLAGSEWFYYGTVYGEYTALAASGDPEDFLPGLVEGTPARADAYAMLADLYRDNHDTARALADYGHVLELNAKRGDIYDKMATIHWDAGQREEAIADWRNALAAFRQMEDDRLPESFWTDLPAALKHIGSRKLLGDVRAQADSALRLYLRRNGYYRLEPLLEGALAATAGSAEGVAWIVDLSRVAPDPLGVLRTALDSKLFDNTQQEVLYKRVLEDASAHAAQPGPEHDETERTLREWQLRWIGFLLDTKQTARAQAALEAWQGDRSAVTALEIRAAAQAERLAALLDRYSRTPEDTPPLDTLRQSAVALSTAGDAAGARRLLEFVYTHELDAHNFTAANFLGLAEVRVEQGDLAAAIALLRRVTLVADEPFQDLVPAADLLIKAGHQKEAREFLAARVKAVPWDLESRVKLGDASPGRSPEAPYEVRLKAAELAPGSGFGSGELDLLAGGASPSPAAAEKPYFYFARLKAAEAAAKPQDRVASLMGAIAIDPAPLAPRVRLVSAAIESGNPQIALAAVESQIRNFSYYLNNDSATEVELPWLVREFLSEDTDAAERAAVARALGKASAELGVLPRAVLFYKLSVAIEPSAETRAALDQARAEQARQVENTRRRPVIAKELGQAQLVEPRLSEGGSSK
jgi:tetratricopeptide (TPR) repeat protein